MEKKFASIGDMQEKKITFSEIAKNVYAYTTQGDPNSAVVIGDDSVLVMEAQATPVMAQALIDKIRTIIPNCSWKTTTFGRSSRSSSPASAMQQPPTRSCRTSPRVSATAFRSARTDSACTLKRSQRRSDPMSTTRRL